MRQAVDVLWEERGLGVTRACGLIGIPRSLYRNRRRPDPPALVARLREPAAVKRRYGYRRLHVLLRREGFAVNRKRVHRLYREAGLTVRRCKRKRIGLVERQPLPKPVARNISWSMDFLADGLGDGRRLRCLTIVDDCTRECLAIAVDISPTSKRVVAVLDRLLDNRSPPVSSTVDHEPEFEGHALDAWAYQHDIRLAFIRPREPVENAYIESFNGRLLDECLNVNELVAPRFAGPVRSRGLGTSCHEVLPRR